MHHKEYIYWHITRSLGSHCHAKAVFSRQIHRSPNCAAPVGQRFFFFFFFFFGGGGGGGGCCLYTQGYTYRAIRCFENKLPPTVLCYPWNDLNYQCHISGEKWRRNGINVPQNRFSMTMANDDSAFKGNNLAPDICNKYTGLLNDSNYSCMRVICEWYLE